MTTPMRRAVVLLSGGLDSATVLAIARSVSADPPIASSDSGSTLCSTAPSAAATRVAAFSSAWWRWP